MTTEEVKKLLIKLRTFGTWDEMLGRFIRACPFCGGIHIDIKEAEVFDAEAVYKVFYAVCADCGCKGSEQPLPERALDAWNWRATDTAQIRLLNRLSNDIYRLKKKIEDLHFDVNLARVEAESLRCLSHELEIQKRVFPWELKDH